MGAARIVQLGPLVEEFRSFNCGPGAGRTRFRGVKSRWRFRPVTRSSGWGQM